MLTYIWFFVVLVLAISTIFFVRQKRLATVRKSPELVPLERSIFTLQVGDIVEYMEEDWVVQGKLVYDDNGYQWQEYLLQDGDRIRWLAVEEDDEVQVSWLTPTDDLEITGIPPKQLQFEGNQYRCIESGEASMSRQGMTLNRDSKRCQYSDYRGPGNQVISIENWDGDIEVTIGTIIRPSELLLLPGDGQRVYE
ncbi:MAG: DUF4178 domain-containing protein [Phormidium sp. BM_Day4_Bin.17]|nr:DUF4178 domain-containing protein [Phormidium sp. BM_Day4_Bin.17]UCJ10892.1 MAG: DUF4178 domain-containing protein [Phormidium sp. PBR-2020]